MLKLSIILLSSLPFSNSSPRLAFAMILVHKLVLFLVTALTLVLALPRSDSLTGELLARTQGGVNLTCASHASQDAIAASQSSITLFSSSKSQKPRRIRIYWHVIYDTQSSRNSTLPAFDGGYLADDQIYKQVEALNTHFQSADISFKLADIDRTQQHDWFFSPDATSPEGVAMRKALHQGGCDDLNIYSIWLQDVDFGGYSTWPWDCKLAPKLDGVLFQSSTIPGGPLWPFNQGKILVHQVGHWCGLFHTFQGGCSRPGDFVSDTPRSAGPNYGCPTFGGGVDSCPNSGKDPIHNFMDYTIDQCKTHFTKGQGVRMRRSLAAWRHNP
ncbi:hypothetical protein BDV93DRAFT_610751 [Ceratobasidium sp. AG-I]|nr:hypothetical protein BDV93DRAFT_610751 [Ceratobasidium sp. AG-I]